MKWRKIDWVDVVAAVVLSGIIGFTVQVELTAHAQKPEPHPIDWTECQKAIEPFKARVEEFNRNDRTGMSIELGCMFSGSPTYKKQPEQKVQLTANEKATLRSLRNTSSGAFEAERAYEDYLYRVHRIHKPEPGDRCFYFVGIKLGDDFITVDPNPVDVECRNP